jgi:uncharacterized protein (DUF433 family)
MVMWSFRVPALVLSNTGVNGGETMPQTLTLSPRIVPLTPDANGVLRVTGTRIPLERIIECYQDGLSPEAIVEAFDSLRLSHVYVILAYFLDHKEEVQEYLRAREEEAESVRRLIAAGQAPRPGMHDELLARQARRGGNGNDAEASQ